MSFLLFKGPIPAGMSVCHACDNTGCVNPDHLFIGTHYDNMRDSADKGRHGAAKLTADQIRAVRSEYLSAKVDGRLPDGALKSMAAKYGISTMAVKKIGSSNKREYGYYK